MAATPLTGADGSVGEDPAPTPFVLGVPMPVESDAQAEPDLPWWERAWVHIDRWGGIWLLVLATTLALANPERTSDERLLLLAIAMAAAGWMALLHLSTPRERLEQRPWQVALYVIGLLIFSAVLMSQQVVFWIFAVIGYLHSGLLRPRGLVYLGVGATSFLINLYTWEGIPTGDGEAMGMFIALIAIQTVLIGSGMVGGERLMELNEERRRTVRRLQATLAENEGLHAQLVVQAREAGVHDERQRLAREIHDTLAQGFTGIITQLEAARHADDPPDVERHLDTAMTLARRSLDEARRSVHALGPGALHRGRLVDALHGLATAWTDVYGVDVEVVVDGNGARIPADVEVALLGVAQEALNNTAKHADAGRVAVALSVLDDQALLDVRDDGRGFDPTAVAARANGEVSGFGLGSMHHRIAQLGGRLTVESEPGGGTAISAQVAVPGTADG